ncbi:MAG: hypothetical protein JNM38_06595 [Acidobacteria bacterium]|nr:hypothetical protein [Acidobacteriota bacterium]
MPTRVATAGTLGFLVFTAWTFLINGVYGFTARLSMHQVADEAAVHQVLAQHITAPGAYVVNPTLTGSHRFPDATPVFGVTYSGMGHDAAGRLMLVDLARELLVMLLAAGLVGAASSRVRARWTSRLAFVVAVGLVQVLASDLARIGIGGWPTATALAMAGFHLVGWLLAAFTIAAVIGPRQRTA